jgi:hypothetical protein
MTERMDEYVNLECKENIQMGNKSVNIFKRKRVFSSNTSNQLFLKIHHQFKIISLVMLDGFPLIVSYLLVLDL